MASTGDLEKSILFSRETLSLKKALDDENATGIIAEFKRRSPSKGVINDNSDVAEVTSMYTANGASALSVLTDMHFFGGSDNDLVLARDNEIPILRKDFIIDEYQLIEARSIGADVVLLIAACLTPREVKQLAGTAKELGMEVLLELHSENELEHICDDEILVGINNRDLKTFKVDIDRSLRMAELIPPGKIKVAESGIESVEMIKMFRQHGFKGFLMGEYFMRNTQPGEAFTRFVNKLKE